jgi:hypothetical protein
VHEESSHEAGRSTAITNIFSQQLILILKQRV